MTTNRRIALGIGIATLAISACPEKTAIWIAGSQRVAQLQFAVGRSVGREAPVRFYGMRVEDCTPPRGDRSSPYWAFGEDTTGMPEYPSRIDYGRVPPGFRETVPPHALPAGCYVARIGGNGAVFFDVDSLGSVHARTGP
jgi:hypothetical protein